MDTEMLRRIIALERRMAQTEVKEVPRVLVPAFSVHKNGTDQTGLVTLVSTKITWSTEDYDTNNNFASDRFTPTVAGKYVLTGAAVFARGGGLTDGALFAVFLYANGSRVRDTLVRQSSISYNGITWTHIVSANGTSDYFEMYFYHENGSDIYLGGAVTNTYWAGTWAS